MVENFNFQTIEEAKKYAAVQLKNCGIKNAAIDINAALKHILKCDEIHLITHKNYVLSDDEIAQFKHFVKMRENDIPLAYILGEKEFMSLKFLVDENTLIPRPDTETLTEEVISLTKCNDAIIDLCTGSGAIGISCAKYTSAQRVLCVDKFEKTLEIAAKNAEINGVADICEFLNCDVLTNLKNIGERFDIAVSNPPYIETAKIETLDKTVKDYEPKSALDGGADGLLFYRKIVENAEFILKKGGILAFEIGFDQQQAVEDIMKEKFENIYTKRDLGNNARAVFGYLR